MKAARSIEDLGKLIKHHRLNKKMSQKDLAEKCQVSQVTISHIENGLGGSLTALVAIVKALNVQISFSEIPKIDTQNMINFLE